MKKFSKRILFALLTVAMVMAVCMPAMAKKKAPKYQNVDAIESVAVDYTKSNVFTLKGWYEKKLDSGRTVKMYFPEIAQCRAYFTVVAAPGNVTDYQAWADEQGYTKMIADRGEVLVLLTPPEGKAWGKVKAETAYVTEAMAFVNSGKNAAGVQLFTNYSTFYLVGYKGGCAPLERWSAANPILVDSQVFIDGKSAGKSTLNKIGKAIYDGTNTGGYDPGIADLDEFEACLKAHGYKGQAITKAEVPVPTWFVGYKASCYDIEYWKSANDCSTKNSGSKTDMVYWQKKKSDAFQTEFANAQTSAKHGISQVKFSTKKKAAVKDLGAFLYAYSRYNVPFAYSNHLSERVDYTTIRVAAQKAAQKAKYLTKKQYVAYDAPVTSDLGATYEGYYVLARKSGKAGNGVVESGILAFSDDNNDGQLDAREYLMYIPDSAKGKKAPVVFQYPGMTQSVSVGFDSTQWWRVADQNGVIIVIMGEAYNNGVALSWKNSDMETIAVKDILKKQVDGKMAKIDWTRIYGSGHSLGSNQVQDFVHTHPEFFTAVASTSFGSRVSGGAYEAVPTMLVTGQSDLPFLMKDLWTSNDLQSWFDYLALADNLKVEHATQDNCDAKVEGKKRTWTYTWNNQDEIPMVKWGQTYMREHNCHPSEVIMAWDFLKNYKMTAKGRYYTGNGKSQKIKGMKKLPFDMDNVESIQSYTDGTIYGEGLVKVEVTYKRGVILDKLSPEDFILEDRGSANPAFGQIKIDKVEVKGQTATLYINQDTDATETNAFIYTGPDKEGSRSRNSYGIFTTTAAWYRDLDGTLYWGKEDTDEYKANTSGMGWQARECLELKLRHASEPAEDAECLADEKGHYNAASKWKENIDANFGPGRLVSFEEAGIEIPSTSADIPEIGDDFVKGHIYVPADYDESKSYPLVVTIQGQNISYWKLPDGSNNFGCSAMFDVSTTSWLDKDAIVVNICDRSSFGISHETGYDYVVDDCSVIKYMLDNYSIDPERIVLHGNSRSTMAASTIIKALAGNPYTTNQNAPEWGSAERDHKLDKEVFDFTIGTYLCNNGMAGGQGIWNDSDRAAIAKTGIRIWCFDSEQDFNNRDYLGWLIDEFKALGYSDEWIAENERISCYPSELFAYWGESDHSVTRMNYWYFNDQLYYGPDLQVVNGEIVYNTKLQPGDTYTVKCRGVDRTEAGLNNKEGMVYTIYGDLFQDWALEKAPKSLDGVAAPCYDTSDALQLPMTGYFYKTLQYTAANGEAASRGVYAYIPEDASCRPYFYVLALPEGADVNAFLAENGWFDVADQRGECLFVIAADKYGTPEEEMAFMNKAMSWLNTPTADMPDPDHEKNVNYWSAFGEWYFAGYGEGAAVLEAWAAKNPIFVIAQAYVDGTTAGADYLTAVGAEQYPVGTNGYDITEDVRERLGDENMIKRGQVPVPTLFAGNAQAASLEYWKAASQVGEGKNNVFTQVGETWQTQYAGPISKVAVVDKAATKDIMDFFLDYTRYDNTSVYGNALMQRVNYADVIVAAHQSADRYAEKKITCPDGQTGTFICTIVEVEGDLREFIAYLPDSAAEVQKNGAPILTVWAGGSQTNIIFFDSTCWWETANKNGIAIIFPDEFYNTSVAVTPKNVFQEYDKAIEMMKAWEEAGKYDFDFTRIYSSGQSMGSMESQQFAQAKPENYAAVASTSFYQDYPEQHSGNPIPSYLINGEGNGMTDTGTMWDDRQNRADDWAAYFLTVDGFGYEPAEFDADGNVTKFGRPAMDATKYTVTGPYDRFQTWTWENKSGIPLVQYGNSLYRPHNCLTSEIPMMWDFLEHYGKTEDGKRVYSASAFAEDDAQEISFKEFCVDPLQAQVESIEATVVPNFYGHKVSQVEIIFDEDVDAEALKAADFTVYDRGSATPEFGALNVCDVQVEGNVVTLMVDQGSDKTADRARNSFGVMNCAGWYMDSEGNLYCGKEESKDVLGNKINPNVANKTCQPRNLDLILCVGETPIQNGIFSTDTKGNMLEDTVWLPTNITGGLEEINLEMIDLGWVAPGYTQINEEGEGLVPVQVIWPENYDPNRVEPYPVIDYQCGGGVCYWELAAGENGNIAAANNLGCNTVYDNTMTEWHKAFPEAIIMSVNVHSTDTANAALEINTALEYAAENWNADITKIVGSGNSQGTIILSDAIRQRSDLWAGYVECNGNFGNMGPSDLSTMDGTQANSSFAGWTEDEFNEMIKNEVAVWMFNGETDGANPAVAQDTYATLKNAHLANGKSEEWVYNNIHISGLQSWKFKQWGETDHSVTKVVAWNYVSNPYNDVYEGQPALAVGDTYKFTGAEANYANYPYTMDFEYTVYAESVSEWVKNLFAGMYK